MLPSDSKGDSMFSPVACVSFHPAGKATPWLCLVGGAGAWVAMRQVERVQDQRGSELAALLERRGGLLLPVVPSSCRMFPSHFLVASGSTAFSAFSELLFYLRELMKGMSRLEQGQVEGCRSLSRGEAHLLEVLSRMRDLDIIRAMLRGEQGSRPDERKPIVGGGDSASGF